jgi:hypothetical protein
VRAGHRANIDVPRLASRHLDGGCCFSAPASSPASFAAALRRDVLAMI